MLVGQEWTEPVIASTTGGINQYPDMTVDNDGIIHLVWKFEVEQDHWKIYYANSSDLGLSWSEAYDVVKNDSMRMSKPHIGHDIFNNLYISYDFYTQQEVYLSTYINNEWSDPFIISSNLPGSNYNNKAIVDKNNRLYVFWYNTAGYYYYKYFENNTWSDIICPFCDSTGIYSIVDFALDADDNVHWIGSFRMSNPSESKLAYYLYNKNENSWCNPILLTTNYVEVGKDIALDTNQNPRLAWRERNQEDGGGNDFTMYKYFDGVNWSAKEVVVEDPWDQQIAVDLNNETHIIHREKMPEGYQLMHYRKINDEWIGILIDTSGYFLHHSKLVRHGNMLYLTYIKNQEQGEDIQIYFTRFDIITRNNSEEYIEIPQCNLYPNPFNESISIDLSIITKSKTRIYIIDMHGRLVKEIENAFLNKGHYHFSWYGTNENKQKVSSGSYLARIQTGKYVITKPIQLQNY